MTSVLIQPSRGLIQANLRELWDFRELSYFLTLRDIKVRYKQTVLGAIWAILQPFLLMVVFTIFLGRLANVPSDDLPYPLFAYAALVPWTLFAQSLSAAATSLVAERNLVSRVYFPRLILPLAAAGSFVIDFLIALVVLIGMMFWYGIPPTVASMWLLALTPLALLTVLAVGIWLAALNVKYRDVRHALPFLIQLWLFATPVAYPATLVPQSFRTVLAINPMTGVTEGFRWALLGTDTQPGSMIIVSTSVTLVLLVAGLRYFRQTERTFADVI